MLMMDGVGRSVRLLPDVVEIEKNEKGHIGVAIGGGAPSCPCLYVVQVFDDGPVARDGRLHAGDELVVVNGTSCKGADKSQVAKMIKELPGPLKLSVNRLQFDDGAGQTLDITLKRLKHWWVERMDAKTADAFGLSRAILCNDMLAQLLRRLEANQELYNQLTRFVSGIARQHRQLASTLSTMASLFSEVATKEKKRTEKSEFFDDVAKCHRALSKEIPSLVAKIDYIASTYRVYTEKAVPDTKDSVKKYLDKKFEYLSFCLKIKEMDDEEAQMVEFNDYLSRIDSGNYEYRVMLRCREKSRKNFIQMRRHVMIKIEMLDEKHGWFVCTANAYYLTSCLVRELGIHLRSTTEALQAHYRDCSRIMSHFKNDEGKTLLALTGTKNIFSDADIEYDDQAEPLITTDN